jgi:CHAT domain-containing protein
VFAGGRHDAREGPPRFSRQIAYNLYRELVAPVEAVLAGKRRLYVVAAGSLASLPFSVLVTRPPEGADDDPAALRGTAWLTDAYALVHLPTIRSLALLRGAGGQSRHDGAFMGFGDPVLLGAPPPEEMDRGRGPALSSPPPTDTRMAGLRELARLPRTARELEAMRRAFAAPESAIHLAEHATESEVRAADLSGVRILAFATHGITPGDSVRVGQAWRTAAETFGLSEPGLVLTPPARPGDADDGFLAASEVAALRLDADWVILSACNTATGESARQGLSELSRAFFYAGARNLLASHWPVADEVAARLTVRTVALEQGGMPRAEAFQLAMREIRMDASHDARESWAHPFYWAPFVLIGDGGR